MNTDVVSPVLDELKADLDPELIQLLDGLDPDDLGSLDAEWEAILAEVLGEG